MIGNYGTPKQWQWAPTRPGFGAPKYETAPRASGTVVASPGITEMMSSAYSLPADLRPVTPYTAPWEMYSIVDAGGASIVAPTDDPALAEIYVEKGGVERGVVVNGETGNGEEEEKGGPNLALVLAGIFGVLVLGGVAFAAVRRRKSP